MPMCAHDKKRECNESCAAYDLTLYYPQRPTLNQGFWTFVNDMSPKIVPSCGRDGFKIGVPFPPGFFKETPDLEGEWEEIQKAA